MIQTLSGNLGFDLKEKKIEELYFLAYMDALTAAYNRNMLEEMRKELDSQALFVTMVDVDGLKLVNDTQGHHSGDRLIQFVADKLKQISEAVFRLGGDEFLCIDREPPALSMNIVRGVSYGTVAKLPTETLSEAMKRADKLMYEHKDQNRIAFLKGELNAIFGLPNGILDTVVTDNYYENLGLRAIFDRIRQLKGEGNQDDKHSEGAAGILNGHTE